MEVEPTECSETSAYKIQKPENYPEEIILQLYLQIGVSGVGNFGSCHQTAV